MSYYITNQVHFIFMYLGVVTPSPIVIDESHMFVRLVGTGAHNEGTVQVYVNGVWGTICDDHWENVDAGVICHMLGFGR
jgi:hypothetical protein